VNIESAGDCWIAVYLDRQHGAVHCANPELGCQYRATRALPLLQPSHYGHDGNDRDAGNTPTGRSLRCTIRPIPRLSAARFWALGSVRAAVGGGRGAGIGAASGAIVGTGVGAANAQNAAGYLQQQYNGYYAQSWRRGDIHHRNIADRCRVMRKLRAILQRQAMDRHQAIRAAQPATTRTDRS
jgi:hypothetical protein